MKSVIMEVQGKQAVIMNDSGDFITVKNKGYSVGQRLAGALPKQTVGWAKWAVSAAVVLLLLTGGGAYAYCTPYAYVSIDVNPSIELSTNIFDKVIGITAMNDDADLLIKQLQLNNCDMQTAMTMLVDALIQEGYITTEEAAEIMVTASSQDELRVQTMLRDMVKSMEQEMDRNQVHANIHSEFVSSELRLRAQELGVTPGKLMLAERYAQSTNDPSAVNIEDWLGKSVKEIVSATNGNGNTSNSEQNGYTGGDSNSNGLGGDQTGNDANTGTDAQNGYTGGDSNSNSLGGEQTENNSKAGPDTQDEVAGGNQNDNGSNGGMDENNNDGIEPTGQPTTESPVCTSTPQCTATPSPQNGNGSIGGKETKTP